VLGVAFALAALAGAACAAVPAHEPDDMALGSPKAPITIIEYASVGCPHCAAWNNQVFPTIRAKYVATGKARLIVREELTGDGTLAAAGFMLARCAGPAKYFPMTWAIYQRQDSMFQPGAQEEDILRDIAKTVGGLSKPAFDACIADKQALAAVNARSERHLHVDKIESTPTFFVNGRRLEGELAPGDLAKAPRGVGHGPAHAAGRRK
jgi:protein-disulfide isomerase